jgi:hypothetical protein
MTTNNVLLKLQDKFPNGTAGGKPSKKQRIRQTLDDARKKICERALLSKSDNLSAGDTDSAHLIYTYDNYTGEYDVGLKCGNSWLPDIFGEGLYSYIVNSVDEKDELIDVLIGMVKAGDFDENIERVRKNSCGGRRK